MAIGRRVLLVLSTWRSANRCRVAQVGRCKIAKTGRGNGPRCVLEAGMTGDHQWKLGNEIRAGAYHQAARGKNTHTLRVQDATPRVYQYWMRPSFCELEGWIGR